MADRPVASIVVATYQRPDALRACLRSLDAQTVQGFEIIIRSERGELAAIRNRGLRAARAPVVGFIDDDTVTHPRWLEGILGEFRRRPQVVGVTGPTTIPPAFRQHRDLFRYPLLKRAYDYLFLDRPDVPGRLSRSGACPTISNEPTCTYDGPVDYLEACNMAFRTDAIHAVGGFDEAYRDLGEWSEPDLCARLRGRHGPTCLWFSQSVRLEHRPAPGAATLRRAVVGSRLHNYRLFSRRWVPPSVAHATYWGFLYAYYYGWQPVKRWMR